MNYNERVYTTSHHLAEGRLVNTLTNLDEEFREERVASIFERPPVLALHELRSIIVHIVHVHKHGRGGGAVTAVTRLHR